MPFRTPVCIACLAAAVAWAGVAHAAPPQGQPAMSKEDVKAQQVRIEEQYDQAQARCKRLQGPARELCNEQARGERDIQSAELQLRVQPTPDNDEKLRLAKAEAAYSRALVKCKGYEGQARRVCRDDAKGTFASAKAEAKLQKDVMAQSMRAENTVRERTAVADRAAEAQYRLARERCEALPADGRPNCLADVRARFNRP